MKLFLLFVLQSYSPAFPRLFSVSSLKFAVESIWDRKEKIVILFVCTEKIFWRNCSINVGGLLTCMVWILAFRFNQMSLFIFFTIMHLVLVRPRRSKDEILLNSLLLSLILIYVSLLNDMIIHCSCNSLVLRNLSSFTLKWESLFENCLLGLSAFLILKWKVSLNDKNLLS